MRKSTISLPILALALGAGCASYDEVTPAGSVVTAPGTPVVSSAGVVRSPGSTIAVAPVAVPVAVPATTGLRAGHGRIESLAEVPVLGSASAGGTVPSSARRVGMKMDDGTVQFFDTTAPALSIGDRIEITTDGFLKRPAS